MEDKKIPTKLVIGLLSPFVLVAVFLFFFARKVDVNPPELRPGLPDSSTHQSGGPPPEESDLFLMTAATSTPQVVAEPVPPVAETPLAVVPENEVSPSTPAVLETQPKKVEQKPVIENMKPLVKQPAAPKMDPPKAKTAEKKQDQSPAFIKAVKEEPIPTQKEIKKIKEAKKIAPVPAQAVIPQPEKQMPPPRPAGTAIPPVTVPTPAKTAAVIPPASITPPVVEPVPVQEPTAPPTPTASQAESAPPVVKEIVAVPPPLPEPKQPEAKKRGSGRYSIQFGSFPKKEEADQLVSQLKARGHDPYIILAEVPNKGTFYRVRVGRYPDRPTAQAAGETIAREEALAFYVASD